MKAVLQRVKYAEVKVDGKSVGKIQKGLLIFLGIGKNDDEKIADKVLIIPRVYTNKPRTTGEGYKGIASQPDPEKAPDMVEGLIAMRKMHIRSIAESGLTCADEMLYPENWGYVEDLLSYVAIGARSVEDQQHRLTVSGFDVASGMKNPPPNRLMFPILALSNPVSKIANSLTVSTP